MELHETKYGFSLLNIKEIPDIGSTLYEFVHNRSGASLVYLANDDTNCCFGIAFKTLPEDSTGVCHIIEHSLLCGSKKYPLKEPFVNLIKGSLSTYLNALTASDWTAYPVASQNQKDFSNLVSVYCDAVFAPLSMVDPKPFYQEGWHLELNSTEDLPSYKGVVYNEMKGAMSNVDEILNQAVLTAMFPDNCYHYNSGGNPADIPSLSYDEYKDFYSRHYKPENSITYFYGKLDIEKKLKFLDEEYFSKFQTTNTKIEINRQEPIIDKNYEVEYEIGKEETIKDNTYFGLSYKLGDVSNKKELYATKVLVDALFSNNNSPLKKAILDAKLGQDVDANVNDECLQPFLVIELIKSNYSKKDAFESVVLNSCENLIKNGIDKKALLASINSLEFSMKEMDTGYAPRGVYMLFPVISSYVYHLPFESGFEFSECFKELRNDVNSDYFEKLLSKIIVNSTHYVLVSVRPSKTLGDLKAKEMNKKMVQLKSMMSEDEIDALIKQNKELIGYQNHVDTPKELATLPKLKLKDIPLSVNFLESKKCKVKGINGISHKIETNGIGYLNIYFNQNVIAFEDLPYVRLLTELLMNLPTKHFGVEELNNEIKTNLGTLSISTKILSKDHNHCGTYVQVFASALEPNISKIPAIINDILLSSKFINAKIKQIIMQLIASTKQNIISRGDVVGSTIASSPYSLGGLYSRQEGMGIDLFNFLNKLIENYDCKKLIKKLKDISKKLFTKSNAIVSYSGNEEIVQELKLAIKELKLPRKKNDNVLESALPSPISCSYSVPSSVSYNALVSNLSNFDLSFSGKYYVISHIINYDYLWKEVRVKGGAYGTRLSVDRDGTVSLTSYRDPNVENTYNVYDNVDEYLHNFKTTKELLRSYIVGAMSNFDRPLSNRKKIFYGDNCYYLGITKKERLMEKKQLLHTTEKDIQDSALLFSKIKTSFSICTIGNENKISECKIFKENKSL